MERGSGGREGQVRRKHHGPPAQKLENRLPWGAAPPGGEVVGGEPALPQGVLLNVLWLGIEEVEGRGSESFCILIEDQNNFYSCKFP